MNAGFAVRLLCVLVSSFNCLIVLTISKSSLIDEATKPAIANSEFMLIRIHVLESGQRESPKVDHLH